MYQVLFDSRSTCLFDNFILFFKNGSIQKRNNIIILNQFFVLIELIFGFQIIYIDI